MNDALQQSIVALINNFVSNLPAIITAGAAAWVVIWRSNKKTEEKAKETNELVVTTTDETTKKLNDVHQQVNGNFTALQARHDALARENEVLRDELARRGSKRSTDP